MSAPAKVPLKGLLVLGDAARTGRQQRAQLGNYDRIHDVGAGGAQCRDRAIEDLRHFREVVRVGLCLQAHRLAQNPEPRALQAARIEVGRVPGRDLAHTPGREGILRVVTDHYV